MIDDYCALPVAAILIAAGTSKFLAIEDFALSLHEMNVPDAWTLGLAAAVPWLEVVAGVATIRRRSRHVGFTAAWLCASAFIAAHAYMWVMYGRADCACLAGTTLSEIKHLGLVLSIVLLAASTVGLFSTMRRVGPQS